MFADPDLRAQLESIVHPLVSSRIAEGVAAHVTTDDVVVIDSPLLVETGAHRDMHVVVVVTATPRTRLARLAERGMDPSDVEARMSAQASLEGKAAVANFVLDNEGSLDELERQVGRLWTDLAEAGS